jgi:hypothetical protein
MYLPDADHPSRSARCQSRLADRDWIIITGQAGGRQVQLAITRTDGLQEIWNALARTGTALVLATRTADDGTRLGWSEV